VKRVAILAALLLLVLIAIPILYITTVDLNDFEDVLLNASRHGNVDAITDLLAQGSDPNKTDAYGNTPLSIAAHFGQTRAIELLLENGALIDGLDGEMSPLHCAVYGGHRKAVVLLLSSNADPDRDDYYGVTPLATAAERGDAETVTLLLTAGADFEKADLLGWRPLHVALRSTIPSESDRLATVRTLLENGADPNADNIGGFEKGLAHDSHVGYRPATLPNEGNKPVAIAESNGFTEILDLLKASGGS
jgi:ankyrin repeat protein